MWQAYAGSKYRVRHVQSVVHDTHLPFTGMKLGVVVREPSEDVPQCCDTYPGKNGKQYEVIPIHAPARGATSNPLPANRLGMFQSTRPRGARLTSKNILSFRWDNMKKTRTSLLMGKKTPPCWSFYFFFQ